MNLIDPAFTEFMLDFGNNNKKILKTAQLIDFEIKNKLFQSTRIGDKWQKLQELSGVSSMGMTIKLLIDTAELLQNLKIKAVTKSPIRITTNFAKKFSLLSDFLVEELIVSNNFNSNQAVTLKLLSCGEVKLSI